MSPSEYPRISREPERYLFLFTRRRDNSNDRRRYVVGYLEKKRCLLRRDEEAGDFFAVQGPIKLVSFDDAYVLRQDDPMNPRRGCKKVQERDTSRLLKQLRH